MRPTRVSTRPLPRLLVVLLAPALLLGACATGSSDDGATVTPGSDDTTTTAPEPDAQDSDAPVDNGDDGGAAGTRPSGDPTLEGLSADLTITVDATGSGATQTWTLTCDPPGGTHVDPAWAWAALEAAGGVAAFDPVPRDAMCTEIYGGPATAQVTGTVDGQPVNADFSRTNGCEISRWDALGAMLGDVAAA